MISIIIPTYNEEQYIEKTLQNLIRIGKEFQFEIIITDGGSSDSTVSIAQRYAQVVKSERGRSKQLNGAAGLANGDIFFFVHADMLVPEGALQEIDYKINDENYDGGGFSNLFSSYNQKIKILGRFLNLRLFDNDRSENTIFLAITESL